MGKGTIEKMLKPLLKKEIFTGYNGKAKECRNSSNTESMALELYKTILLYHKTGGTIQLDSAINLI